MYRRGGAIDMEQKVYDIKPGESYALYKLLGTRYIIPYITKSLKSIFEYCKILYEETGNKVELDLRFCKFNPDNYVEVCRYCDYIKFVDSDNPVIHLMLDHNSRVSSFKKMELDGSIKIEAIPSEFDVEKMLNYIKDLDQSKVYRLKGQSELNGRLADVSILIAMCIGYLYPNVSIDLSEQASEYFRLFKKFWSYSGLINRDSYNMLWQNNILRINVISVDQNGENIFYVPGVGEITESTLNQNYNVIPFEFGSSKNISKDPEFKGIFDAIANELQRLLKKRKKKKLTSELNTIERG